MIFRQSTVLNALTALTLTLQQSQLAQSIQVQYTLTKGTTECQYAPLTQNEQITTSIFITSGDDLKARTILQGPIAQKSVSSSAEVLAAAMRVDKHKKGLSLNRIDDLDFENLFSDDEILNDDDWDDDGHFDLDDYMDDVMFQDYYYMDDDDEYEFMEDDAMDDIEIAKVRKAKEERDSMSPEDRKKREDEKKEAKRKRMEEMRKKRMEATKRKAEAKKKNAEAKRNAKRKELMELNDGKPIEKTFSITEEGWYRFCVEATHTGIEVEFEMRRSSILGRANQKTGHVMTYERHDMMANEKKLMAKLSASAKAGGDIKEEDLEKTKEHVSKINRLLNEIREKQTNERHRLGIHKAVNEHSHSRMVVGSLFETVFYIVVSGFQVYTIRKWFSANPILAY